MKTEDMEQPPLSRLGTYLALIAIVVLAGNVGLVSLDVFMRWLFNQPQSWVSDIAELTYPIAIVCCFPVALESGSMISVRFMGAIAGKSVGWFLDCFGQLLLTLLLGLFAFKLFQRASSDWVAGYETVTLRWPIAPTWFLVAALLVLAALIQAHRTWLIYSRRIENV